MFLHETDSHSVYCSFHRLALFKSLYERGVRSYNIVSDMMGSEQSNQAQAIARCYVNACTCCCLLSEASAARIVQLRNASICQLCWSVFAIALFKNFLRCPFTFGACHRCAALLVSSSAN